MTLLKKIFYLLLFLCLLPNACLAEAPIKPLRVGVIGVPPLGSDNPVDFNGIAVDDWREIATNLKIPFVFVDAGKDVPLCFEKLKAGEFDMLVGPTSITPEKIDQFYYSYPFFFSQISVAIKPEHSLLNGFLYLLKMALLIFPLILIYIFYVITLWLVERGSNPEVPKELGSTIKEWTWRSLLLKKQMPVFPSTFAGRIVTLVWLVIIFIFLSIIPASITTMLVVNQMKILPSKVSDLYGKKIGIQTGTVSIRMAKKLNLNVVPTTSLLEGMTLLKEEKVDAVMAGHSNLMGAIATGNYSDIVIAPLVLGYVTFGFVFRDANPMIHEINKNIVLMKANDELKNICRKYVRQTDPNTLDDCVI